LALFPDKALGAFVAQPDALTAEGGHVDAAWGNLALVLEDEGEDAASGAAVDDAGEALGGGFGDVGGEITENKEAVAFGHFAGVFVELADGGELVAKV